MREFLTVEDRGRKYYGTRGALLYRGLKGVFIVDEKKGKRFFHLGERLADASASPEDILISYLAAKSIDISNQMDFRIAKLENRIGTKYGRIYRPVQGFGSYYAYKRIETEQEATIDLFSQLDTFMYRFAEIARVVQPSTQNLNAYGYEIRNLTILACTEVELLFKRLIWDDTEDARGNMNLYFKAEKFARLSAYQVRLPLYSQVGLIEPFEIWHGIDEYVPLPWYRSYNDTKHNRRSGSPSVSLKHLIDALTACAVLLQASHPTGYGLDANHPILDGFKRNFQFTRQPSWAKEKSYWAIHGNPLRAVSMPGL